MVISVLEPGFLVAERFQKNRRGIICMILSFFFFFKEGLRREGEIKLIVILTSHKSRECKEAEWWQNQYYNSIYHNTMSILRFKCWRKRSWELGRKWEKKMWQIKELKQKSHGEVGGGWKSLWALFPGKASTLINWFATVRSV